MEQLGVHRATGAAGSSCARRRSSCICVKLRARRRSPGAFVIELELLEDERGLLRAHVRRRRSSSAARPRPRGGAVQHLVQRAARHAARHALPGGARDGEAKLVRCTRGAIYDVIVDLRRGLADLLQLVRRRADARQRAHAVRPRAASRTASRRSRTTREVHYQMSAPLRAGAARGVRWDDPAFGIEWPLADARSFSERDRRTPTSGREARARHRRDRLHRPSGAAAAREHGYEVHAS